MQQFVEKYREKKLAHVFIDVERASKRSGLPSVDIEFVFVSAGNGCTFERCTKWITLVSDFVFLDENTNMLKGKLERWAGLIEKNRYELSRAKTEVTRSDRIRN